MSKRLKARVEAALREMIGDGDLAQVRIQNAARMMARETIPTPERRRACLRKIMCDDTIDQFNKRRAGG